jgi:hypothetical protein
MKTRSSTDRHRQHNYLSQDPSKSRRGFRSAGRAVMGKFNDIWIALVRFVRWLP